MARLRVSRALATLVLRDLEAGMRAAVAAGRPAPPELRHLDGLSRTEAAALARWAAGVPEIAAALGNRQHPQHREIAAMRELVNYFAADHPARADGSPEPWAEPISEPLLSYAMGWRQSLDAAELSPAEAGAVLDYSLTRSDLAAARFDKAHPQHQAVSAEIAALAERASQPAPSSAAAGRQGEAAGRGQEGAMNFEEAQARADELGRAMHSRTLSPIVKGKIAQELAQLHTAFPEVRPFTTAGMRRDEIEALKSAAVRYMPHLTDLDEAAELTEGLLDRHYAGSNRYAARDRLAAALSEAAPASPASAAAARGKVDFRSDRTRELTAQLRTLPRGGAQRNAVLEQLHASLAADQAGSAMAAAPALRVNAPQPDLRSPGERGVGIAPPARVGLQPRGSTRGAAIAPAELSASLAGLRGAARSARLAEIFGDPAAGGGGGEDAA